MTFQELIALTGARVTGFQPSIYSGNPVRIPRLFVDKKLWLTPMDKEEETFDKILEMLTSPDYERS